MQAAVSHFFLSEWLWSITHGGYHTPINMFVMIALFLFVLRYRTVPSVLLSVSANLFSFFAFTGLFWAIIVRTLDLEYIPDQDEVYVVKNLLFSCLYLGLIYAVLQSLFFYVVNWFYTLELKSIFIITFLSNIITAWIMYTVLPL